MALDVVRALTEGLDRLTSRNGFVFVGAFTLIAIVGNVALDSATVALEALTADLAAQTDQPQPQPLPEGATPLAVDLPGSVIALLVLGWLLAWAATSVLAVRVVASDHTEAIPDDLLSRRLTLATVNEVFARIVVLTLIGIGFVALVLPGIFLAICFYFVRPLIAIEDRNAIDAMTESWRLSRGNRIRILLLLVGAVAVYAAISIAGTLGALALSALPVVGTVISIVFAAVANVFWLAVSARAFVQFHEPVEPEPEAGGSEPDDGWDDPPGVEW
ncbi:hypothetical protein [Halalkalicoccus jeotgali]|uniref:DUF7847 domain-containing protein n=1 Tax=Halalkalicoccus jeotgali (strain DSM 18796 / CECT 7217 / JCM 14584 / KCTC 4019 / B3) TaxID=795797 RepID=D8JAB6_HALJB|nr:hypothetical protein [Halalkalicoccus jeotgali]ADJ14638.1 hypothetical protein HacjB3_06235 [Halalkalicoccus jeotgali B3]ELY39536.1 hypothetical protein C497_04632 [Halalkalicoccus jeotgali B3]